MWNLQKSVLIVVPVSLMLFSPMLWGASGWSTGHTAGSSLTRATVRASREGAGPLEDRLSLVSAGRSVAEIVQGINAGSPLVTLKPTSFSESRTIILAKQQTVRNVVSSLACLYNGDIQEAETAPGGNPTPGLVLGQAQEARGLERRFAQQEADRVIRPLTEFSRYALQASPTAWQKRYEQRRADDKAGKPATDPLLQNRYNLAVLGSPESNALLRLVAYLSPAQRQTLATRGQLDVRWTEMSSQLRTLALQSISKDAARTDLTTQRVLTGAGRQQIYEEDCQRLERIGVRLLVEQDELTEGVTTLKTFGMSGQVYYAQFKKDLYTRPPFASPLPIHGNPYRWIRDSGRTPMDSEEQDAYTTLSQTRLRQDLTFDPPAESGFAMLKRLSEATEMPIYAEVLPGTDARYASLLAAFPNLRQGGLAFAKGTPLTEVLDRFCERVGRVWWTKGGVLYFRDRLWSLHQSYEVSPSFVHRLSESVAPVGPAKPVDSPEPLRLLGTLAPKQLVGYPGCVHFDAGLTQYGAENAEALNFGSVDLYPFLQFFCTLPRDQQAAVLSEPGLLLTEMQPAHRQLYRDLLDPEINLMNAKSGEAGSAFRIVLKPLPGAPTRPITVTRYLFYLGKYFRYITVSTPQQGPPTLDIQRL